MNFPRAKDSSIEELDEAVDGARRHEEWRMEYMTMRMMMREEREEGREEGRAEGRAEGYAEAQAHYANEIAALKAELEKYRTMARE